ncbi:MAG TPA: RNA methyltransferase [Saprospiraceae bacterium]|nr:RNA methyltransferase [Saprospiraceae bacterium]HRX29745.1 RNA methyltransferase [Saprospiraceae bacterium]
MRKLKLDELDRLDTDTFRKQEKIPLVVVLDNIRSAMNVGSIFRTCDAFAVQKIYLCGITATPPNREINKTAIGATETVMWEYADDILPLCQNLIGKKYKLIGVEQTTNSIPLSELKIEEGNAYVLVFGNEVEGVSESILPLLDKAVEIPQYGTKHSLNVAVCGGIVVHQVSETMRKFY